MLKVISLAMSGVKNTAASVASDSNSRKLTWKIPQQGVLMWLSENVGLPHSEYPQSPRSRAAVLLMLSVR